MGSETSLYGFAILRNGIKYDYPFVECLRAMSDVCELTYLALGESEDGTEKKIKELKGIKVINTVWDDSLRSGGLILSQQTNIALEALRTDKKQEVNSWGLYLQCDEVIHEREYLLLKEDIRKANKLGHDAISFRYLHFWQSHHQVAINKKWYPQEIRAVKLDSNAESWGDAQSFQNVKSIYQSEVVVYHYGHVREESKYLNKKYDILKLYHSDSKMKKYKKREKRFDNMTECIAFHGTHPAVMQERIKKLGEKWALDPVDEVYILCRPGQVSKAFEKRIHANNIFLVNSIFEVPIARRDQMVILNPNWPQRIWYGIKTPLKMRSKLALPWSDEFRLMLMLAEKEISVS